MSLPDAASDSSERAARTGAGSGFRSADLLQGADSSLAVLRDEARGTTFQLQGGCDRDLPAVGLSGNSRSGRTLEKTKLCRFFQRGDCERGEACSYAHGRQQIRPQPDLYRTQLCHDFLGTGFCRFGEACRYAHRMDDMRPVDKLKPLKLPPRRRRGRERGAARSNATCTEQDAGGGVDMGAGDGASEASFTPPPLAPAAQGPAEAMSDADHGIAIPRASGSEPQMTSNDSGSSSLMGSTALPALGWHHDILVASDALGVSCYTFFCSELDEASAAGGMSGCDEVDRSGARIAAVARNTFIDLIGVTHGVMHCEGGVRRTASAPPGLRGQSSTRG
eukprot:CAMPEP_0176021384 /NCGR_PEP_ID=MMETSP0120_2-20121206/10382_1 /TAXON_ID=160619 /ORGANISM="Kryptoperidinium foliaceum, Strain CCMP 1326" /LENGTH=334 /DNA_ID=CAMNT_0017354497 /DNA_START=64 /DNA_END=1068 /DNA_ORIENTATION=-